MEKELLSEIRKHKISYAIDRQMQKHPQLFSNNIKTQIKRQRLQYVQKALEYSKETRRLQQMFEKKQIKVLFFKGIVLAKKLYNDLGARQPGDIDILTEKTNFNRARNLLEKAGYEAVSPSIPLSRKQIRVMQSITNQMTFRHRENKTVLELHWYLTNPKFIFNATTSSILKEAIRVDISGEQIYTLSTSWYMLYLAAHGGLHQWCRLFWIKDFAVLLAQISEKEYRECENMAEKHKLTRTLHHAIRVVDETYGIPSRLKIEQSAVQNRLLKMAMEGLQKGGYRSKGIPGKIQNIFYRIKLFPKPGMYLFHFYRLRTHYRDWEEIKLPDALFFLYYLLRPFLVLRREIFRRKR